MTLTAGVRLGGYEILARIGAGGMGEVYRATDTELGREVAIKVLPTEFAHDPERLARFEREARVLASLNHPGIAAIYGFEQSDGVPFLVLEYVPGETLQGPLPVEDAVSRRLRHIADARFELEEAQAGAKPVAVAAAPAAAPQAARGRRWLPWGVTALLAVAAGSLGVAWWRAVSAPRPVTRAVISLPPGDRVSIRLQPSVALSPDGSKVV